MLNIIILQNLIPPYNNYMYTLHCTQTLYTTHLKLPTVSPKAVLVSLQLPSPEETIQEAAEQGAEQLQLGRDRGSSLPEEEPELQLCGQIIASP